jgi:hypothetical protein
LLLLSLLALPSAAVGADKATCDAKPFTLSKPIAQATVAAPKPPEVKVAEAKPVKARARAPKKPTISFGCKQTPAK